MANSLLTRSQPKLNPCGQTKSVCPSYEALGTRGTVRWHDPSPLNRSCGCYRARKCSVLQPLASVGYLPSGNRFVKTGEIGVREQFFLIFPSNLNTAMLDLDINNRKRAQSPVRGIGSDGSCLYLGAGQCQGANRMNLAKPCHSFSLIRPFGRLRPFACVMQDA